MNRVCMRPGCDRPADARISYDAVRCEVWLNNVPDRLGPVQEICEFHAQRLTVPRGWNLSDLRLVTQPPEPSLADFPQPSTMSVSERDGKRVERRDSPRVDDRSPRRNPDPVPETVPGGRRYEPSSELSRRRHPANTASELFADDPSTAVPAEVRSKTIEEQAEPVSSSVEHSESPDSDPAGIEPPERHADEPAAPQEPGDVQEGSDRQDDEEARPSSPLLARAFGQVGPQHSVLSDVLLGRNPPAES